MNNKIQPHLGLVDHNNLKTGEEILSTINYEMFPDEKNFLIKKENYLVISTEFYSKMKKKKRLTQSEYPLTALPWIINQIENGFFKKKDDALLTLDAIRHDGLVVAGWVLNRVDPGMSHYEENAATLKQRIKAPLLGEIPWLGEEGKESVNNFIDIAPLLK